jgi:hypothetical protein
MAKISKYNQEGYKDPTPYEALKRIKDPKRQIQGAQAKVVGQYFEKMIDAACRFYEDLKIAVIEKPRTHETNKEPRRRKVCSAL